MQLCQRPLTAAGTLFLSAEKVSYQFNTRLDRGLGRRGTNHVAWELPSLTWLKAGRSLQESLLCACPGATLPSPATHGHHCREGAGLDELYHDPLCIFL